jgi:hypothetical protein
MASMASFSARPALQIAFGNQPAVGIVVRHQDRLAVEAVESLVQMVPAAVFEERLQSVDQFHHAAGFADEFVHAGSPREDACHIAGLYRVGRDQNIPVRISMARADFFAGRVAVQSRHVDVHQHEIPRRRLPKHAQRCLAVCGLAHVGAHLR